jgi:hypothetical protein
MRLHRGLDSWIAGIAHKNNGLPCLLGARGFSFGEVTFQIGIEDM